MANKIKGNYDLEFKKMIVKQYGEGISVQQLMEDYDLKNPTVYKWISLYSSKETRGNAAKQKDTICPNDVKQLEHENLELKKELEILKKCITIFSRK